MKMTRREFLSFTVTAAALGAVVGCGGGGGSADTATVLQLTHAMGYETDFDPDLEKDGHPYVVRLRQNGNVILQGSLRFTVNGQVYGDGEGPVGNKSVISRINAGDIITWHQL